MGRRLMADAILATLITMGFLALIWSFLGEGE
jgi:hypothetical protein